MMPTQQNRLEQTNEETKSETCLTIVKIDPRKLKLSPENNKIYKSIDPEDPTIKELAREIAEDGVLEPLVISTCKSCYSLY